MKRDMDLVRQILLTIEAAPGPALAAQPTIKNYTSQQVNYHLLLLLQGHLISALDWKGGNQVAFANIGLTWDGYEFLDTAREETIWQKAKAMLGGRLDTVSLAVLQQLLISLVKGAIGLP